MENLCIINFWWKKSTLSSIRLYTLSSYQLTGNEKNWSIGDSNLFCRKALEKKLVCLAKCTKLYFRLPFFLVKVRSPENLINESFLFEYDNIVYLREQRVNVYVRTVYMILHTLGF